VEQSSETDARILVGGRPYRDIDSRCWAAGRLLADMDAEGVALQVVSPVPVTFCHDAPARCLIAKWEPLFGEHARQEIAALRAGLVGKYGPERASRMADLNRNLLIYPNLVVNDIMAITVRTFISALAPTAVPVPSPVAYCADAAVTGTARR